MMDKSIFSKQLKGFLYQLLLIAIGIIVTIPILYAISISFMPEVEVLTRDLRLLPSEWGYIENYKVVFQQTLIFRFLLNSFIVAFVASSVRIIVGSLAAFSFAFFEFKGKKFLFALVVGSLIIPTEVLIVPNYFTTASFGWINTYIGMMAVYFIAGVNIFVIRQNFLAFPKEIFEAALIDGCSNFEFFWRILLPGNVSILTTVFISSFVGIWNVYLWPLIVTNANEMRTAQVAVTMLNVNEGNSYGPGSVMAAAVIILIPSILVFLFFQRKIIGGFMTGSVKG